MRTILLLMLFGISLISYSQVKKTKKVAQTKVAKQLPTKQETFEYLRGKLLSLSIDDRAKSYCITQVRFNENTCTLRVQFADNSEDNIFIGNLNANTIVWDTYETSVVEGYHNQTLERLTISSVSGLVADKDYDPNSSSYYNDNKASLYFSIDKINGSGITDFKSRISKALKRFIETCGGMKDEKDPFGN